MKRITIFLISLLTATSLFSSVNKDLEEAYQKEYAFLTAQKSALENRLKELKSNADKRITKAQRAINRLQENYITQTTRSQQLVDLLDHAQEKSVNIMDNSVILEATISQAGSSLSKHDYKIADIKDGKKINDQEKIETLFKDAAKLITSLQSVRKESGEFYLFDGKKAEAELFKIGNIATYGKSADISGALAPAGGGYLKLWKQPTNKTADALIAGQSPDTLDIFIYENMTNEVEDKKEKTIADVLKSGGIIGYLIAAIGLIALGLVIARGFFLRGAGSRTESVSADVKTALESNNIKGAIDTAKSAPGAAARVITSTLRNVDRDREHIEDIISESILHESSTLDRFGTAIIVIAAVAPLMGLLGTVTGMISTFEIITEFGTGDPKMLSGGISEALVTTELGLIVAIPAIIFGNLLSGWADRIKNDMEQSALMIINVYKKTQNA